ncbi:hypothetical protein GOFOIKOB_4865 [Methylobacterium tardum]|uniref:Uncharacterized protein n=1 Tax=Methylobacterium tardum TaxID=374432 RepID=A0AA37TCF5_9HYPH|nr:hypothetical protein [Methylobacterium tardum]URD37284.1 hypothetical protein M6G65_01375 [Methylobacterium tardum]GJE51801.1 hypothetical protein GOFOIKOB_4865 [Methylobacterium tardum]GLS70829.1 hypothetical protein GCM10007890_28420 [Methylobacterium tardum]
MPLSSRSPTAISDEGRHARDRGDPITANPYPAESEAHWTWERGYRMPDAQAQDPPTKPDEAPQPDSSS